MEGIPKWVYPFKFFLTSLLGKRLQYFVELHQKIGVKKMAKLGNFETPTGAKGNVFEIGSWGSLILGSMIMILTFGIGEHFAARIQGKVPTTQVTQPWQTPVVNNTPQKITL